MFVRFEIFAVSARFLRTGACLLACGVACASPLRADATEAKWTSYLRAGPGLQYGVLDEIAPHHPLSVLNCSSGWCRVLYERAEGYVEQQWLTDAQAAPVLPGPSHDCFDATMTGWIGGSHVQFCGK